MKVIVVAQQKGGVGKTATAVNLAFYAAERGARVVFIDFDQQGNASYALREYQSGMAASELFSPALPSLDALEQHSQGNTISVISGDAALANLETMPVRDAGARFRAVVEAVGALGFDLCIVDTAPSLGIKMAAALLSADFVVSPIELEAFSIQGIKLMMTTIANIKTVNPRVEFLGMVASKVDARNPRHIRHEKELRAAYPELLIPHTIGLRSSIADALASGVPVWAIKRTAARSAAKEVRALSAYLCEKMEIV
jgi:chromosome partitioning protein